MAKFITLLLIAAMLLVSCATVEVPKIVSVETEENEVFQSRGIDYQLIEDENIELVMQGARVDTETAAIGVEVKNKTTDRYNLIDTDFEIFRGNLEDDTWTSFGQWNAESYYLDAKKKYDTARVLRVLEIFGDIFFGIASGSNDSGTIATGAFLETGTDLASGIATVSAINATNGKSPKWLSEHLLYPSVIRSLDSYEGVMMFPMGKKRSNIDMKIVYKGGTDEEKAFYFERTDREEILNPWLDSRFKKKLGFGVGYDPFTKAFSIPMMYFYPKGIGFYGGINVKFKEPENVKEVSGSMLYKDTDKYVDGIFETIYGGLTIKIVPYTWLLVGVDCIVRSPRKVVNVSGAPSDITYYRYDYNGKNVFFTPQIGVNCIFNFIDVFAILEYDPSVKKVRTFFGGGFAFATI